MHKGKLYKVRLGSTEGVALSPEECTFIVVCTWVPSDNPNEVQFTIVAGFDSPDYLVNTSQDVYGQVHHLGIGVANVGATGVFIEVYEEISPIIG